MEPVAVAHAANERVTLADGRTCIDLFCGSGTVLLGHSHPAITAALTAQLGRVWNIGLLPTAIRTDAQAAIESFFPATHALACLYATGMEAAEFAMRLARGVTGRPGLIGFDRSNHGKSLATASLAWPTPYVTAPAVTRLPSPPDSSEAEMLDRLARALADRSAAAVFVEPILGSGGGYSMSPDYYQAVSTMCVEHGTLLVFDEILTGFHRTGRAFMFEALGVAPDVILVGKAMGNGFPVSGVVTRKEYEVAPAMLPGSTYAANPLAAAVVAATLQQMRALPIEKAVTDIGRIVTAEFAPLSGRAIAVRGRGAMWILEFASEGAARGVSTRALANGVIASSVGRWLRLLPPATIDPALLTQACGVIRDACLA
jgi:4-aminobutyrate aminotransferase-like enzyme